MVFDFALNQSKNIKQSTIKSYLESVGCLIVYFIFKIAGLWLENCFFCALGKLASASNCKEIQRTRHTTTRIKYMHKTEKQLVSWSYDVFLCKSLNFSFLLTTGLTKLFLWGF